ncbi:MAG: NADH:ubiquinone reductase (Na(+)-transporting) subunit B [Bacteroidales bacterium]|nr:NADH:ubiquinone reductase (Na(+)-transporting) subunit B [Bacteroidales bacterium]MBQ8810061.1 NADH:ubiquinone reductase (Na(+)-transporting) subunit B [Bacteroidales bacterium]
MNGLRNFVDKIKPTFEKGGKLGFLHSTFDAFETFLFVPNTVTRRGAHVRDCVDLKRVMIMVVIALVPAMLFGIWNTGYQHSLAFGLDWGFWNIVLYGLVKVLPLYIVSYLVGLGIEFVSAQIQGHEVNEGYLVSGMLIPLIVPVDVPLWMLAIAVAFAVIIGKEVFGGTGMNIWNPALLTRAFLFFSYPSKMSGDTVWTGGVERFVNEGVAFQAGNGLVDGFSGATPLANASMQGLQNSGYSLWDMILGTIPGSVGETSVIAILIGAVILLWTGVASWKIMASSVLGGLAIGYLGYAVGATDLPGYYQLVMGGFLFGTVFMATDPVTSAQTECGKWIYGFLVGALAVTVRLWNPGYPEGMMLAILLMNTFAPLIDHYVIEGSIKRRAKKVKTA